MRGVLLAGGTGSRLLRLTKITNKHLLPIYDRSMVEWAVEALVAAGVTDLLLVTGGSRIGDFMQLLGDGHELGLGTLNYAVQEQAGGIAEALGLAESFAEGEPIVVMLADNVFEWSFAPTIAAFKADPTGCRLVLSASDDQDHLRHLGVPDIDDSGAIRSIVEKPQDPPSNFAVTGVYCYEPSVFDIIKTLVPSGRGELEITDVNNHYVNAGRASYDVQPGFWGDAGESIAAYQGVGEFVSRNGANKTR